ncbi:MAG: nuclear transport factor 2 family protein [Flavisolibacter sp.]|nr:nuclear transport factor 2 family protein [Flavisolibacter sp.]
MPTTNVSVKANTALVEEIYNAFKQGNIPFILDQVADDCEWNVMGSPLLKHAGTYRGKEVGQFFEKLNQDLEFTAFDVLDVKELKQNEVIALGRLAVKGRPAGKETESRWAMHWKFSDGKVTYFQDYTDTVQLALVLQ